MTLAVFYDTETTGLPRDDLPIDHPDQPHLVQVAALMVDLDTRLVVSTLDVMVKPAYWAIPLQATEIHGITQSQAMACGVDENIAISLLVDLCDGKLRVGHNEGFDSQMIEIALNRRFKPFSVQEWASGKRFCTMAAAKPIMKLPARQRMANAGYGHEFKAPRLSEAYTFFSGLPMKGAHNAKMDARATIEVFFALKDMGLAP